MDSNNNTNSNNIKTKITVMFAAIASVLIAGIGMNSAAHASIIGEEFPGISIDDIGQSAECVGVLVECRENSDNIKIKNNGNGDNGNDEASLTVIKQVRCDLNNEADCEQALEIAQPNDFILTIEANNPDPSQFSGSSSGTEINLGAGQYVIDENNYPQIETELRDTLDGFIVIFVEISGDCVESASATAEGDISAGEEQTCSITNVIEELL